jgi:CSLREA domain-containing protein
VLAVSIAMLALPASAAATTYTVNTTTDSDGGSLAATCGAPSPTCSLRDAIKYSASGDKVVVPADTYTLTMGALAIAHNLTISGAGANSTTVSGNNAGGVFTVAAGKTVSISALTITGGKLTGAGNGAGINDSGNLTLTGVVVTGNKVESVSGGIPAGGGIEIAAGNVTLGNTQVTNNQAVTDSGGGIPEGAGIDDSGGGYVSISDSQITSNTVSIASGGGVPEGAGIHDGSAGTMAIADTEISQNTATGPAGSAPAGGGLANDGSGVVTVTGSTLTGNTATATSNAVPGGGGIATFNGSVSISNTTISFNTAISVAGGGAAVAEGGGVLAAGQLDLTDSTLTGNSANGSTDGTAEGGGLVAQGATSVSNTTIIANTASATGTGSAHGGGVFASTSQPVRVLNATVDANSAAGPPAGSAGGNFFAVGSTTAVAVENTIVSAGVATTNRDCGGSGTLMSQGNNLESGTDCGFTASGDHQSTDPLLGPLQDNGGTTQTQAVQPGSPIIDAGNTADCPPTDQRGVARPQGPACDIGAFEVELPVLSTRAASGVSKTAATLNATVTPNTLKPAAAVYHFEWGTTAAYGNSTPSSITATGSGSNAVSAILTGLLPDTTYHFRIVATNADGGSTTGADQTFRTAPNPPAKPIITRLGRTNGVFAVGPTVTPISGVTAAKRHPRGTVFSFTLNVTATVTVKIMAQLPGRQVGRKCKPATAKLRKRPRCTRAVLKATLTRSAHDGANRMPFSGRPARGPLSPGSYQAVFAAAGVSGRSGPQTIGFRIVKR